MIAEATESKFSVKKLHCIPHDLGIVRSLISDMIMTDKEIFDSDKKIF